jgi:phosphopantothenoylcysteine decarboxylase/phosphopantothenate--cysteine ligase
MKKILLGITGCVAIYKSLQLIRLLKKTNYEIQCVMTESATKLIAPQLFSSISGNFVRTELFDDTSNKINHIDLSRWADLVAVVPATANIIGKLANGIADDLLSTLLMASNKDIIVAPAMNTEMWNSHPFQRNLKKIKEDGIIVLEATEGDLACGEIGKGRMEEPENIFNKIEEYFKK